GVYSEGFVIKNLAVIGSRYAAPQKETRVLDWAEGAGKLMLSEGNLPTPLEADLLLSLSNKITLETDNVNKLSIVIAASTGLFHGSFIHSLSRSKTLFSGALLQVQGTAGGVFLIVNKSGAIQLSPR
ncbi:MAG: hypothetical protein JWL90_1792, partial [Chthoniobacteraceae bacterium]|nr:hypothetical protein [Chthoniobacteraceae bacterium]